MTVALHSMPAGVSRRTRPTAVVHRPATVRRRPGTYRRRRAVATALVAGVVGTLGILADSVLTGPGGVPASAAGAGTASPHMVVRADAGDSLWSIAEDHHGDVALSRYVEALIDVNGGTRIVVGQLVRLP
jgi:hypothetical protein